MQVLSNATAQCFADAPSARRDGLALVRPLAAALLTVPLCGLAAPVLITGDYNQPSGVVNANGLMTAEGSGSSETATISNAGTVLNLTSDPGVFVARVNVAGNPSGPNATGTLNLQSGAWLIIDGTTDPSAAGVLHGLSTARTLTSQATVRLDGAGTRLLLKGNSGFVNLAASSVSDNGTASLQVTNGAVIEGESGANDFVVFNVGGGATTAGTGTALISGAGSRVSLRGAFGPGSGSDGQAASVNIGRGTGTGTLTVASGGQLTIDMTGVASTTSPLINVGSNLSTATGTLIVDGVASRVVVTSDGRNPGLQVGRLGNGTLNITNGALFQLNGNGAASASNTNDAFVSIGGGAGVVGGGTGSALIAGAGSRLEINGTNPAMIVGRGTGAQGTLTVASGGFASSFNFLAGIDGGVGSVQINGGTLALRGIQQFGPNAGTGAALVLGRNGGTGSMLLASGAAVTLSAPVGAFSAVSLGGTSVNVNGGTGSLSMAGGSTLTMSGGRNDSGVFVGRIGTGVMAVTGSGTRVDVSGVTGGGRVFVGVEPFGVNTGTGTLVVSNSGYVNAGATLGVAHNGATSSGGTGTLAVNSGGTVRANNIYVGNQGVIIGCGGTLIGNVVSNQGLISTGCSVGQLTVEGGYSTVDSGKFLLEIESDGLGGFRTDTLVFRGITAADLSFGDSLFEFSFLADADPNQAVGLLNLDRFFLFDDGTGNLQGISALGISLDDLFADVAFNARADSYSIASFEYSASRGFLAMNAAPVPEPTSLFLLAFALALLCRVRNVSLAGRAAA